MLITAVQLPRYLIHAPYSAKPKYFPEDNQLGGLNHSPFPSRYQVSFPQGRKHRGNSPASASEPGVHVHNLNSNRVLSFLPALTTTSKSDPCNNHRPVTIKKKINIFPRVASAAVRAALTSPTTQNWLLIRNVLYWFHHLFLFPF